MRKHPLPVPALTIALAALIAAGVSSAALAQDARPPVPQGVPQAPVGHCQPRPAELPPDVRREERDGSTAGQRAFDKKLENSICQKC